VRSTATTRCATRRARVSRRQVDVRATELERFADCSSAWLFERVVDPKTIDAEADAMLRGKVAHQTLYAFYSGCRRSSASTASRRRTSTRPLASCAAASTTRCAAACGSS
jgi:hypothetical protein